jgi:Flp pilus assembly protein TadD
MPRWTQAAVRFWASRLLGTPAQAAFLIRTGLCFRSRSKELDMSAVSRVVLLTLLVVPAPATSQEAMRRDARKQEAPSVERVAALEHHKKGRELMRAERWQEAIEELHTAVGLDPDLVMAHYDLGQSYMAARDFEAAVDSYEDCRDAWMRMADALQKGDFEAHAMREDRIRELRDRIRDIQRVPATPGTAQYAQLQAEATRTENLIRSLDMSRKGGRKQSELPAELSLALGSAYFRSNRMDDAEREYNAAIRVQPKLGQAHNNLAVVYLTQGRPTDALEAVRQAEKTGFQVSSELKQEIEQALKGPQP